LPREKKLIKARRLKLLYHTRIAFCNQFYLCYNLKKQRILPHLRLSSHNGAAFLYARRKNKVRRFNAVREIKYG